MPQQSSNIHISNHQILKGIVLKRWHTVNKLQQIVEISKNVKRKTNPIYGIQFSDIKFPESIDKKTFQKQLPFPKTFPAMQ